MSRFGVLAGGWSRCRLLVVLISVLAMVSPLGAVSSAQAAVKATLSLSPSTAFKGEMVKATGRVPGAVSRPVWVQRKSGTRWVTLVKARTTRTGSYTTRFKAPAVGSYRVRTLAPRVTIARKVRTQYVSSAKTLKVVAQTASLSMPATLLTAKTATATLTFRPVRAGRAVALQMWRSGAWTSVATGRQSAAGTASLTMKAGTPASYSYRAWTAGRDGAPAFYGPTRTMRVPKPASTPAPPVPPVPPVVSVYYANCTAVRAAGADPLYRGDPGYSSKLDRDGDGIACE